MQQRTQFAQYGHEATGLVEIFHVVLAGRLEINQYRRFRTHPVQLREVNGDAHAASDRRDVNNAVGRAANRQQHAQRIFERLRCQYPVRRQLLFDHRDVHGIRRLVLSKLTDRYARALLSDLEQLAQTDRTGLRFRDEVVGPVNRLAEFVSAPAIRRIIGQRRNVIDLRAALDEGHIILVNLSGGDAANDADTELLGRLLTRFLFFHVKRRTTSNPFWFYLDECQRYLSGDIPSLLAEARKFRMGVTLSHQWQSQLGKADDETLAAVHNATNLKVAFRIKHPTEAKEIAEAIIPLDLEVPVKALTKPTVIGHHRTMFENWSKTESETYSSSRSQSVSYSETDS